MIQIFTSLLKIKVMLYIYIPLNFTHLDHHPLLILRAGLDFGLKYFLLFSYFIYVIYNI